ncbi:serine hydrolase [Methylobacterium sp. WL9]|nr:serine hydrolase [Methylobacterium sp. WL9]
MAGLLAGLTAISPLSARARVTETTYAAAAEALVEPYLQSGLFSGTILVAKNGKPVFRRAYGLANREWSVANTLDTHFRIGSLTKSFTAAAILKLAEAGKLGLDDRIRQFVPGAPASWDRVTLRHLLGHTSGIINYTALPDYYAKLSRLERTPQEIVALVEAEPLLFEPGTRMEYSNTGYVLLGMAIEAASGQPYAGYLREAILTPLGLKETGYDEASAVLPRRASGYRFGQAQWRNAPPMASSIAYAAGGLYSTVDDLLAWSRALFGGRVVSTTSLAATVDDGGRGYGLGWYVGRAHERRLWSHGGAVSGFLSMIDHYPDDGLDVIVLANNENAPVQKISRELSALWFGVLDPPDSIVLEDIILDRYAGTYQLGPRHFLTLTREHGRLLSKGTAGPPILFLPESDRTFVSPAIDARITIDTEPDGRPNGLVYHQAGRDRIAPRTTPEEAVRILAEPRPLRREVSIDRARLRRLTGRYDLGPSFIVSVTLENGRLYAQATGQPRNELFPEGERAFFLKSVDAQLSFDLDGNGRATGLVLHQNGLDTPGPRIEGDLASTKKPARPQAR